VIRVHTGRLVVPAVAGHHGFVDWAQVFTIVAAIAAFTSMQAFWIARALDRVETRLDRIEAAVRELGERVTRLEERVTGLDQRVTGLDQRVARLEPGYHSPAA
jgi:hypothetical protein